VELFERNQAADTGRQGGNDVIIYTINSYILQQNLPNAQLIIYPDAAHGSLSQYPELFVRHGVDVPGNLTRIAKPGFDRKPGASLRRAKAMSELKEPTPKTIKIPGPDHPITIERNPARVVVTVAGRVIADTREALTLSEAHYSAVQYIPRKDVHMTLLSRTDRTTYCPYKGDASLLSAFRWAASARPTRCGPTKYPMLLCRHQGSSGLLSRQGRCD